MTVKCFSPTHIGWALGLGLLYILLWTIGLPILGFIFLTCKRSQHESPKFKRRFLILYQGFKPNRYYWELVNIIRKAIVASIHVFVPYKELYIKMFIAITVMLIFLRIQLWLRPFKNPIFTHLEAREMCASIITVFGAMVFIDASSSLFAQQLVFVAIVFVNAAFFSMWIYCFLDVNKH